MSFEIATGQTFALVGESGCGKSTIARSVAGICGRRAAASRSFRSPPAKAKARTRLAPGDGVKYPHQFSGGQRQRIAIARALASEPKFIVCDEPTSALDVSVQAQVLNLMRDLQQRLGLTYLFISHNLAVVAHMADKIGVMYLGRLVEWGEAGELLAQPKHPFTRMLLDTVPDIERIGRTRQPLSGEVPSPLAPPSGCAFHPRCPLATARCAMELPQPRISGGVRVACHAVEERRVAT